MHWDGHGQGECDGTRPHGFSFFAFCLVAVGTGMPVCARNVAQGLHLSFAQGCKDSLWSPWPAWPSLIPFKCNTGPDVAFPWRWLITCLSYSGGLMRPCRLVHVRPSFFQNKFMRFLVDKPCVLRCNAYDVVNAQAYGGIAWQHLFRRIEK